MRCARHNTVMRKDAGTGVDYCLRCDLIDKTLNQLEDLNVRDNYTIADVESYLKGEDIAEIGKVLFVEDDND